MPAPAVTFVLNGKTIAFAPLRYAPSGSGLVVPYAVASKADIRRVIAAGEDDAAKHLHKMPDEWKERLGRPVEGLASFLKEVLWPDKGRAGDKIRLSRIGIRLSRRIHYSKHGAWRGKDYGPDPLQQFEAGIGECAEQIREHFLLPNGDIDAGRFERAMIARFRADADTLPAPQPQYDNTGCYWLSSVNESKVGSGKTDQMKQQYAEYLVFRRRVFALKPEAARRELSNSQKNDENPARRNMLPCLIDDMNHLLVDLPYRYGIVHALRALRPVCDSSSFAFNMGFFHVPRLELDGLVPALHPFGELLSRSKAFLKIAHAHFMDENQAEAAICFRGALMAAAMAYKIRCQNERLADRDWKRDRKKDKAKSPEDMATPDPGPYDALESWD